MDLISDIHSELDKRFTLKNNVEDHEKVKLLLDQYKVFVENLDKTISRKIEIDKYFFSIISGTITICGFIMAQRGVFENVKFGGMQYISRSDSFLSVSVLLLILSVFWLYLNIRTASSIHKKRNIIYLMEDDLPYRYFSLESFALFKKVRPSILEYGISDWLGKTNIVLLKILLTVKGLYNYFQFLVLESIFPLIIGISSLAFIISIHNKI
ncbi:hypothetical protein D3C86_1191600 [compost metagenome]